MKIKFDNAQPIYSQIIGGIKKAIARGEMKPGDKLLSQRDLATELKVNPNTVQRAYREMEMQGLSETMRGQGTFIAQKENLVSEVRTEMISELLHEFVTEMQALSCDDDFIIESVTRYLQAENKKVEEINPPRED